MEQGYVAQRLDTEGRFRLARSEYGSIVLIVAIHSPQPVVDVSLPHFRTRMNVLATITEAGRKAVTEKVCLLEVMGTPTDHPAAFAGVITSVAESLTEEFAVSVLVDLIDALVDLFMPRSGGRGSALGLWGEIVFMLAQPRLEPWVEAWHADPEQRHDFAMEGRRIEVKTSGAGERHHHFDARQLRGVAGLKIQVVSICTTRTDAGTSLAKLAVELQERLEGRPKLQIKALRLIAETLGDSWASDIDEYVWDRSAAIDQSVLIDSAELPAIEFEHESRVLSTRCLIDCAGLGEPISLVVPEF